MGGGKKIHFGAGGGGGGGGEVAIRLTVMMGVLCMVGGVSRGEKCPLRIIPTTA